MLYIEPFSALCQNGHDIISIFIGKKVALTITKKYWNQVGVSKWKYVKCDKCNNILK